MYKEFKICVNARRVLIFQHYQEIRIFAVYGVGSNTIS